jgi:superfamily II DNA helicase RecQ
VAQPSATTALLSQARLLFEQQLIDARRRGIVAAQWRPEVEGFFSLLIVSIEDINDRRLYGYLGRLREEGKLARIVIDEAHLLVEEASFRPKMAHVVDLRQHGAPLVLLSATLPPVAKEAFSTQLVLSRSARRFRAPTTLTNAHVRSLPPLLAGRIRSPGPLTRASNDRS